MRKLVLIGLLSVAAMQAKAVQTVYDITGSMIGQENLCFAITIVFTSFDCSYGDTREFQTGVFAAPPDNWIGPTGGASYYAQGGPEEDPANYIPSAADNRIDVPITGTWTIDDNDTPDPTDDSFSAEFVLGQISRNLSTGQSSRAVERWTTLTQTLAPTAVNAATANANGGADYIVAFNGVFPDVICDGATQTDCFPTAQQLAATPNPPVSYWVTPNTSAGVGIERATIFSPGQAGPPTVAPPFPAGPAFPAASTSGVFTGYSCDDINLVDCPTDDATAGQLVDGSVLVWGGLEDPGFDNLIIRLSTNDQGQITDAEALWTQEFFVAQGVQDGNDNSWTGGRLNFTGQAQVNFSAVDDNANASEGVATPIDVLANDVGVADGVLVTITQQPTDGNVVVNGSGGPIAGINITYTSNSPIAGAQDTFEYQIDNGVDPVDTATVTVTRTGSGANDDTASTRLNTAAVIDATANDSGFTDPVTVTITMNPDQGGTATVNGSPGNLADIDISYIPAAPLGTATYVETFEYQVDDGVLIDTATVTVTVNNAVPAAPDGAAMTGEGVSVDVDVNALVGVDLGDAPSTVAVAMQPANGTAAVNGNVITYTPDVLFAGMDMFDYSITDDDGETDTGTITVTVTPIVPTANDDAATTDQGDAVTIDVFANDVAGSGAVADHTVTVTGAPSDGSTSVSGTSVTYTPDAGFSGQDQFTYTLEDANGDTATATVTIDVIAAQVVAKLPGTSSSLDLVSLGLLLIGVPLLRRRLR